MSRLEPKNWSTFQHYKDRSPAWIKLHRTLLDNIDYYQLSADAAKALPLIWLLASERNGQVPEAPELAFRIRISEKLADDILIELIDRNFLVEISAKTAEQVATHGATLAQRHAKANGFGSRHISDATKRTVWARDGGKCCQCDSTKNIEYDHKHPVSKGGNSEEDNIQLLCRACNRAKRVTLATHAQPLRSLEREEEREKEIDKNAADAGLSKYAFESGVIKLNQKHFDQWTAAYSNLNLPAELLAMTEWAGQQASWFNAVKGLLNKRDKQAKLNRDNEKANPFKWNGIEGVL